MKRKNIAKTEADELLPDYDLSKMRLLKRGPGHAKRSKAKVEQMVRVTLDPDVATVFEDEKSVNEALRTVIRVIGATTGQ
jgi:hypothetical protein